MSSITFVNPSQKTIPSAGAPTSKITGEAIDGVSSTYMRSDGAPALADSGVTEGKYTNSTITVDKYGRVTSAENGTGGLGSGSPITQNLIPGSKGLTLGSKGNPWGEIFVSSSTLNFVGTGNTVSSISANPAGGLNLPLGSTVDSMGIGSILIKGSRGSIADLPLPTSASEGDGYLVGQNLHVSTGSAWVDAGPVRGPAGLKGIQGETGLKGEKGSKGERGFKGETGTGSKGDIGPKGATGDPGGQKGDTGAQGPRGDKGLKGDKGDIGSKGDIGPRGEAFQVDEFNVDLDDDKVLELINRAKASNASPTNFYVFVVSSDTRTTSTSMSGITGGTLHRHVVAYNGTTFVDYGPVYRFAGCHRGPR